MHALAVALIAAGAVYLTAIAVWTGGWQLLGSIAAVFAGIILLKRPVTGFVLRDRDQAFVAELPGFACV